MKMSHSIVAFDKQVAGTLDAHSPKMAPGHAAALAPKQEDRGQSTPIQRRSRRSMDMPMRLKRDARPTLLTWSQKLTLAVTEAGYSCASRLQGELDPLVVASERHRTTRLFFYITLAHLSCDRARPFLQLGPVAARIGAAARGSGNAWRP